MGRSSLTLQGDREGEGLGARPGASAFCSPIWSPKVPLLCDGGIQVSQVQLLPVAVSSIFPSRVGPIQQRQGPGVCEGMWTISHSCRSTQMQPKALGCLPGSWPARSPAFWSPPRVLPPGRSVSLSSGRGGANLHPQLSSFSYFSPPSSPYNFSSPKKEKKPPSKEDEFTVPEEKKTEKTSQSQRTQDSHIEAGDQ